MLHVISLWIEIHALHAIPIVTIIIIACKTTCLLDSQLGFDRLNKCILSRFLFSVRIKLSTLMKCCITKTLISALPHGILSYHWKPLEEVKIFIICTQITIAITS